MATRAVNPQAVLEQFIAGFKTKSAAADALDISLPYLTDLARGRRSFSAVMLEKLGLEREERIQRKERKAS